MYVPQCNIAFAVQHYTARVMVPVAQQKLDITHCADCEWFIVAAVTVRDNTTRTQCADSESKN